MNWLIGSGQVVVGIAAMAAWYFALRIFSGRLRMTNLSFSIVPAVFVVWMVLGIVTIVYGIGRL